MLHAPSSIFYSEAYTILKITPNSMRAQGDWNPICKNPLSKVTLEYKIFFTS